MEREINRFFQHWKIYCQGTLLHKRDELANINFPSFMCSVHWTSLIWWQRIRSETVSAVAAELEILIIIIKKSNKINNFQSRWISIGANWAPDHTFPDVQIWLCPLSYSPVSPKLWKTPIGICMWHWMNIVCVCFCLFYYLFFYFFEDFPTTLPLFAQAVSTQCDAVVSQIWELSCLKFVRNAAGEA